MLKVSSKEPISFLPNKAVGDRMIADRLCVGAIDKITCDTVYEQKAIALKHYNHIKSTKSRYFPQLIKLMEQFPPYERYKVGDNNIRIYGYCKYDDNTYGVLAFEKVNNKIINNIVGGIDVENIKMVDGCDDPLGYLEVYG